MALERILPAVLLLIVLWGNAGFTQDYQVLLNDSGAISYLYIEKDLQNFIKNIDSELENETFELKTVVVYDIETNDQTDNTLNAFLQFVNKNGSKLQHLHFSAPKGEKNLLSFLGGSPNRFTGIHLISVLKTLKTLPLIHFGWENQSELKEILSSSSWNEDAASVLRKLKSLSFAGSELSRSSMPFSHFVFDSLQELKLERAIPNDEFFESFLEHTNNFPELRKLDISYNDLKFDFNKNGGHRFTKLEHLIFFENKRKTKTYRNIVEKEKELFNSLRVLEIIRQPKSWSGINEYGEFQFIDGEIKSNYNIASNETIARLLPNLQSMGNFTRYQNSSETSFAINFGAAATSHAVFFTTQNDLENYTSDYPNSKRSAFTLMGPKIEAAQCWYILKRIYYYAFLKNIYLIGTSIEKEELFDLRAFAADNGVRIHQIDRQTRAPNFRYYDNNWHFQQMMHDHMMRDMQRNIQQNIPKIHR
jgi:hypothetical protein